MTESLASKVATFAADVPDWAVADALNAPDAGTYGTKRVKVSVSDVRALLMLRGAWGGIVMTADNTAAAADLRGACITVRDGMLSLSTLDTDDTATYDSVKALADAILAAGLMDQATHDALLALADKPCSWADLNNGGVAVTSRDVGLARGAKE